MCDCLNKIQLNPSHCIIVGSHHQCLLPRQHSCLLQYSAVKLMVILLLIISMQKCDEATGWREKRGFLDKSAFTHHPAIWVRGHQVCLVDSNRSNSSTAEL